MASGNSQVDVNVLEFDETGATSWLWWDFWPVKLLWNLLAYLTFIIPVAIFVCYVKRCHREYFDQDFERPTNRVKRSWRGFVKFFVFGNSDLTLPQLDNNEKRIRHSSKSQDYLRSKLGDKCLLTFCATGLLLSYIVWGYLQEKIMTTAYWVPLNDGSGGKKLQKFKDSQFIVFANRIVALFISTGYVLFFEKRHQKPTINNLTENSATGQFNVPFYKYFYASFSNVMSSWCQYESLKYISFPAQVLGKAGKILPVMIMSRLVTKKSYRFDEYFTGFLISLGVCLFMLLSEDPSATSKRFLQHTTWSGAVLMLGYVIFDSFTNNWQDALYVKYGKSNMQMMCGVNCFSALLTLLALVEQNQLTSCLAFLSASSEVFKDVVLTSCFSAIGQLFIFYTIAQFGVVSFTIIMTIRQACSILLSCVLFGHYFRPEGTVGVILVFFGLFMQNYYKSRSVK